MTRERPYLLRRAGTDEPGRVDLWSSVRLPFEPREWLKEMRDDLRDALRRLVARPDEVLHATYSSLATDFVDTENVLIYNVGPAHLANAARYGLRFERRYVIPPVPEHVAFQPMHHVSYALAGVEDGFPAQSLGVELARWSGVALGASGGELKAANVWYALRRAGIVTSVHPQELPRTFAVAVRVGVAEDSPLPYLAQLVKPLLDGIVSAMHHYVGPEDQLLEAAGRLAMLLPGDADDVVRLLVDPTAAPLGGRQVLHPYRAGIKWDPADEYCLAAEIIHDPEPSGAGVALSISVYEVS